MHSVSSSHSQRQTDNSANQAIPAAQRFSANPADAPRDRDAGRVSRQARLCAALRSTSAVATRSFTGVESPGNAAEVVPRVSSREAVQTPLPVRSVRAVLPLPIQPPSYEASATDSPYDPACASATRIPETPAPPYHIEKPPAPGVLLFQADLPNGSPPLQLNELRPGMSLNIWDGKSWQTTSVKRVRVAINHTIHVVDAQNSHDIFGPKLGRRLA
jgi:hypothetical protein